MLHPFNRILCILSDRVLYGPWQALQEVVQHVVKSPDSENSLPGLVTQLCHWLCALEQLSYLLYCLSLLTSASVSLTAK